MRSKEEAHDYRYFPDPDLPPLIVSEAQIEEIRRALPEVPSAKAARFAEAYALRASDVDVLIADMEVADFFEATANQSGDPKSAANWIMTYVMAAMNTHSARIGALGITPAALAELIQMVNRGAVTVTSARRVFTHMMETGKPAAQIVTELGLTQVGDDDAIGEWAREVVAAHPDAVARYQAGEVKLLGFLMGEVMKKSRGKADAGKAKEIMKRMLEGEGLR